MILSGTPGSDPTATISRLELPYPRPWLVSCRSHADVAQLVEHHLAKVRVAGSNPVVRSRNSRSGGKSV